MNPCPFGNFCSTYKNCRCTPEQIRRYLGKLSAPFVDRIDLHVDVPPLAKGELSKKIADGEATETVRNRVDKARQKQRSRGVSCNALMNAGMMEKYCQLNEKDSEFLEHAIEKLALSARTYHRIIKVARTIADLAGMENIARTHLAEAMTFRRLERLMTELP